MGMNGQLRALTTVPQGKEPHPIPCTNWITAWVAPEPMWMLWRRDKCLSLPENWLQFLGHLAYNLIIVTILTEQSEEDVWTGHWAQGWETRSMIIPLHAELYPISHLLALLGAHPILHVSRIRVN